MASSKVSGVIFPRVLGLEIPTPFLFTIETKVNYGIRSKL